MSEAAAPPTVTFKKVSKLSKVRRGFVNRKRKQSDDEGSDGGSGGEEDLGAVLNAHRKSKKKNPMIQSTGKGGNKDGGNGGGSSSDEGEDGGAGSSGLVDPVQYKSSKELSKQEDAATKTNEIDEDFSTDAQARFERDQGKLKGLDQDGKKDGQKQYHGMSMYGGKVKEGTSIGGASNGFVRKGPIRAPTNIRMSVRWDYAIDLCKDYKETGYCTFGDSCKFAHDRTDYKHGWELEKDWESGQYGRDDDDPDKYVIHSDGDNDDDDDELPFKCFLCRESFTDPVVTKCGHYFCEKCAIDNFRNTPKCYVCDKNTQGVFRPAKELMAKLNGEGTSKQKRRRNSDNDDDDDGNDEEKKANTKMEVLPSESDGEEENEGGDNENDDE